MIPVDLRALVPLPAVAAADLGSATLNVGDVVRARVVDAGMAGRPVLMLGAATLAIDLPFPVTPDQSLEFTVLEVKPELRLALARPAAGGPLASGTGVEGDAADLQLSPQGRLLSRASEGLAPPAAPPALPLRGDPAALLQDPSRLALALREGVDRSGLFYERHQAQWVTGQRSEASLRQEPQAAWTADAARTLAAASSGETLASRLAGMGLPAEALEMVRQQVELVQQQTLLLRAELAPGLTFDWRTQVAEDGRGGRDRGQRRWETVLQSEFERLSRVESRVSLQADQLDLVFSAAPEVLERLQLQAGRLALALAAAGLSVRSLEFRPAPAQVAGDPARG